MDLRVPLKPALGLSWWDVNEQLALIPKGYLFSNPEMMHFCKMMTWNHPFTSQHTEESSWAEGRVWQGKWLNCLILTENKTLKSVPKQNFHKNNWAPASKEFHYPSLCQLLHGRHVNRNWGTGQYSALTWKEIFQSCRYNSTKAFLGPYGIELSHLKLLNPGNGRPVSLTLKGGLESLGLAEKSKEMMRSTPLWGLRMSG